MTDQVITGLETQKRNKDRVNVYLNGEYAFSLALDEAAKLRKGQTLGEADVEALRNIDAVGRAVDRAARFLSYRPRSEQEVRRNLAEKETAEPVIDEAVERLRSQGFLDDYAFAAFWVENRSTFKPLSPRALRYELKQKGVPESIIAEVLADQDAEDSAYRAAEKQAKRMRGMERQAFREKLAGFLQRRGFRFSETRKAIETLIETIDEDDPTFFADSTDAAQETWADD